LYSKKIPQPIGFDNAGKGKGQATGILGISSEPPQPKPFTLPSLTATCNHSAKNWPKHISPSNLPTPQPYQAHSAHELVLSADMGEQLGSLLLSLVE